MPLDPTADNRPAKKKPFPYGKTNKSVLDIRSAIQPYDADLLMDAVHGSGGSRVLGAIEAMPNASRDNSRSVVHGVMDKQTPNVTYRPGETKYSPRDEMINIDPGLHQRYPVATSVHEGTHALQSGKLNLADKINSRKQFGSHDSAARELGPSLIGHLAETEARRRGGSQTPNVSYQFPSGYSPSLEFMRQQADRFGLFNGARNGNIDEHLAKNPQWLRAISQPRPAGEFLPPLPEPTGQEMDGLFGAQRPAIRKQQSDVSRDASSLPSPDVPFRENSSHSRADYATIPGSSFDSPPFNRRTSRGILPSTSDTIVDKEPPMPFDTAASARPATPVNKKRRKQSLLDMAKAPIYGPAKAPDPSLVDYVRGDLAGRQRESLGAPPGAADANPQSRDILGVRPSSAYSLPSRATEEFVEWDHPVVPGVPSRSPLSGSFQSPTAVSPAPPYAAPGATGRQVPTSENNRQYSGHDDLSNNNFHIADAISSELELQRERQYAPTRPIPPRTAAPASSPFVTQPEGAMMPPRATTSSPPPASASDPFVGSRAPGFDETMDRYRKENAATDELIRKAANQRSDAAYPSTDAGIADFQARRSARDRMLGGNGLNVGRTGSGERVNPMMPGAAGMGTGPSQVNPMMGDKAAWYVNKENQEPYDPNTEQRQTGLLNEALTQRFNGAQGGVGENFMRPLDGSAVDNTSENRIQALKEIGGLAGASRAGLMDRFVSGSSLTRGPNDTPERTLQLDKIAAIRQGEKQRKLDLRGNVNDPTSIAGRIATRGAQKGFDRQQRMADRARGPSQEDMILRGAMNGNPSALRLADMMAQGNRERGIGRDRNQALRDVAGIENPQPSESMQRQGLMEIYGANGGAATYGVDMDTFVENGLRGGGAGGGGGKPPAWMFDEAGEPIDQERFDQLATIYNLPPEDRDRLRGALKPKSVPFWRRTTPSSPPSMPPSSYVGRGY